MRVEDGIRYYEDGECVVSGFQWNNGSSLPGAAVAYPVDGDDDLVCILAEAITREGIKEIWELVPKYRGKNCEILRRTVGGNLLLL